jgi:hypothetical protein
MKEGEKSPSPVSYDVTGLFVFGGIKAKDIELQISVIKLNS